MLRKYFHNQLKEWCFYVAAFSLSLTMFAQGNGKLQIHFLDVGQGDSALLISPSGETVLVDDGPTQQAKKAITYLKKLGLKKIDYHIASHYHSDHIGGCAQILQEFPVQKVAYDRGESYKSSVYQSYLAVIGSHRQTADTNTTIVLDAGSADAVKIQILALNGNGIKTDNENDLSIVTVVHYGKFDAELGGDLSGFNTTSYQDVESSVDGRVGQIELYKVHHHGSSHSSNPNWLQVTHPKVGIISCGNGNTYGHPTEEALDALHRADVKCYWTETGNGVLPEPGMDMVAGNIVVQVAPQSTTFTVTYNGNHTDTYSVWGLPVPSTNDEAVNTYWWKKSGSTVYHYSHCSSVNEKGSNWEHGSIPPTERRLHKGCPR